MCLITEKQSYKIAKRDIPVWKHLINGSSPLMGFKYEKDVLYKQPIQLVTEEDFYNRTEWEWVTPFDKVAMEHYCYHPDIMNPNLIYIEIGFHSFYKRAISSQFDFEDIVDFIIPKGSRYYKDETGLIVSNRIILKNHEI
jgi:hypothetical protein